LAGTAPPPPDPAFLERARAEVADAASLARITVILGTERVTDRGLQIADGTLLCYQPYGQEGVTPHDLLQVPILRVSSRGGLA
jgi:hypothetical protein